MIKPEIIKDASGTEDVLLRFSDERKKLLQKETGIIYGSSVIDKITGYDDNGKPMSRFSYEETDELDEEFIQEAEENE